MPRLRRIMAAGFAQHLIQRGHNRQDCFFRDGDYAAYLHWLDRAARAYGVTVHAYTLMPNHVHLVVTPGLEGGVSKMMQYLGRHYVGYVNKTHRRTGSLWERRFNASVVESETYLLALHRYIELNPVRAGMVKAAEQYRWSSAGHHLAATDDPLILDHDVYMRLGATPKARAQAYAASMRIPLEERLLSQIRAAVRQGGVLGSDQFKDRIENQLGRRVRLGRPGRKPKPRDASAAEQVLGAAARGGARPLVFALLSLVPSLLRRQSAEE